MNQKLRIISDGTVCGTQVLHNGARIDGVRRVSWELDARGGVARISLDLLGDAADIDVEGERSTNHD